MEVEEHDQSINKYIESQKMLNKGDEVEIEKLEKDLERIKESIKMKKDEK